MKRLYIDLDGVLMDYNSINKTLNIPEWEDYDDYLKNTSGLFLKMQPVPGAIDSAKKLAEFYESYLITTIPMDKPSLLQEKVEWINKFNLRRTFYERVVASHGRNFSENEIFITNKTQCEEVDCQGAWICIGSDEFPNWDSVVDYLLKDVIPFSYFRMPDPDYNFDKEKARSEEIFNKVEQNTKEEHFVNKENLKKFQELLNLRELVLEEGKNINDIIPSILDLAMFPENKVWDYYYKRDYSYSTRFLYLRLKDEPRLLDKDEKLAYDVTTGEKIKYFQSPLPKMLQSLLSPFVTLDILEQVELPFTLDGLWQAFCLSCQTQFLERSVLYTPILTDEDLAKVPHLYSVDPTPRFKIYDNLAVIYHYGWHERMGFILEKDTFEYDGKHFKVRGVKSEVLYEHDSYSGFDHILIGPR